MSETELEDDGVNIFDLFETDVDAEENGKWFEDIMQDGSNLGIKVRCMTSQAAIKNLTRLMAQNKKHMVKGKLPEEIDKKILIQHLASTILIGWKGVKGKDNKPIPYSTEAAELILTKLPRFREAVVRLAQQLDAFKAETQDEVAGN
jgi:hypothetical protein